MTTLVDPILQTHIDNSEPEDNFEVEDDEDLFQFEDIDTIDIDWSADTTKLNMTKESLRYVEDWLSNKKMSTTIQSNEHHYDPETKC